MKICIIDSKSFISRPELLEPLYSIGDVDLYDGIPKDKFEVVDRGKDADIIAFGMMQFSHEMIDRLEKLKILQFIGTGVNNFVDMDYAKSKGIKVLGIEGYGSNAVAEFALSMALALNRKIPIANRRVKNKEWSIEGLQGGEIAGSTVGVIGTGNIGQLVAEKYSALGARVIACDIFENELLKNKGVPYVTMDEIFRKSDIVTLHMKVTDENKYGIGKNMFDVMKPGSLFVNVARAELVDPNDLFQALVNDKLGGAAVDVYYAEPPAASDYRIASLSNVIATPHIGYDTQEAIDNSIKLTVQSIVEAVG